MVSVDGTESKKIVVRGMQSYMILHTLCVVFHLTSFAISLFVIAPEQIEITTYFMSGQKDICRNYVTH